MVADTPDAVRPRLWLGVEFAALYIGAPLAMALFLPPRSLFPALMLFMLAGLFLLWRTGGFDWRALIRGWGRVGWGFLVVFSLAVGLIGWGIMTLNHPAYMLNLSPERLRFLSMVWLLYPLLSALPQELIFRPLFFHRFGALFPDIRVAVLVNGAVFSFAHLMYWSVTVALMTFAGGVIFALAYLWRGFPSAWMLHAMAGNMLFATGMGYYFWSGNVVRPF